MFKLAVCVVSCSVVKHVWFGRGSRRHFVRLRPCKENFKKKPKKNKVPELESSQFCWVCAHNSRTATCIPGEVRPPVTYNHTYLGFEMFLVRVFVCAHVPAGARTLSAEYFWVTRQTEKCFFTFRKCWRIIGNQRKELKMCSKSCFCTFGNIIKHSSNLLFL